MSADTAMAVAMRQLAAEFKAREIHFREPFADQVAAWLEDVCQAVEFPPEEVATMRRLLLDLERPEAVN